MLTELVEAHVSEANVKRTTVSGRNQFGQPLFIVE